MESWACLPRFITVRRPSLWTRCPCCVCKAFRVASTTHLPLVSKGRLIAGAMGSWDNLAETQRRRMRFQSPFSSLSKTKSRSSSVQLVANTACFYHQLVKFMLVARMILGSWASRHKKIKSILLRKLTYLPRNLCAQVWFIRTF